jgi:hypothetical protein
MKELQSYDGPFIPNLRYEDLSKEILIKLLVEAGRTLTAMGAFWYSNINAKYGDEEANKHHLDVWIKEADFCMPNVAKAANIEVTDVASCMKVFQLDPAFNRDLFRVDMDIKAPDRCLLTIHHCPSLAYQEREGRGREKFTCQVLEPATMIRYFACCGVEVEPRPLKVPPRAGWSEKGWTDIACQWEFQQVPRRPYDGKLPAAREEQLDRLIEISWEIHELAMGDRRKATGAHSDLDERQAERRALLEKLKWRSARSAS